MFKNLSNWDAFSKFAVVLCFANALTFFGDSRTSFEPVSISDFFWLALGTVFLLLLICSPQIGMLILIRITRSKKLRTLFLLVSLAIAIEYFRFMATENPTGSSTAGLIFMFYPVLLATVSFFSGLILVGIEKWIEIRNRR